MVDTINPNTSQPDNWNGNDQTPVEPVAADNRFYGGFDKPDETKINLADTEAPVSTPEPTVASQPVAPPPQPQMDKPQPIADVAPVQPAEVKHTSYVNTADMVNWRGVMVIAGIGLVATILLGVGLYFGISALNESRFNEKQAELESIRQEIATLDVFPDPLELPVTETPVEETPVVVPVETPTETPVVIPTETITPEGNG